MFTNHFLMKYLLITTGFLWGLLLGIDVQSQTPKQILANYQSTYYELEFDENGNEVILTECGEPTVYLKFICPKEANDCHFTYEETIFHIVDMTQGSNEEEFLITYKNDFGEEEKAIFYYDRIVNQLLMTFDGMNLAFVAKEDLSQFTVKDECHQN